MTVAHLDFWGRRVDATVPVGDLVPPFWRLPEADAQRLHHRAYVPLAFQPADEGLPKGPAAHLYVRPMLLSLRQGHVYDTAIFAELLGLPPPQPTVAAASTGPGQAVQDDGDHSSPRKPEQNGSELGGG